MPINYEWKKKKKKKSRTSQEGKDRRSGSNIKTKVLQLRNHRQLQFKPANRYTQSKQSKITVWKDSANTNSSPNRIILTHKYSRTTANISTKIFNGKNKIETLQNRNSKRKDPVSTTWGNAMTKIEKFPRKIQDYGIPYDEDMEYFHM